MLQDQSNASQPRSPYIHLKGPLNGVHASSQTAKTWVATADISAERRLASMASGLYNTQQKYTVELNHNNVIRECNVRLLPTSSVSSTSSL